MGRLINVVCPYCGTKNSVYHESLYNDAVALVCDETEGGCDRLFVADVSVSITAKAKKVEGEDERE